MKARVESPSGQRNYQQLKTAHRGGFLSFASLPLLPPRFRLALASSRFAPGRLRLRLGFGFPLGLGLAFGGGGAACGGGSGGSCPPSAGGGGRPGHRLRGLPPVRQEGRHGDDDDGFGAPTLPNGLGITTYATATFEKNDAAYLKYRSQTITDEIMPLRLCHYDYCRLSEQYVLSNRFLTDCRSTVASLCLPDSQPSKRGARHPSTVLLFPSPPTKLRQPVMSAPYHSPHCCCCC